MPQKYKITPTLAQKNLGPISYGILSENKRNKDGWRAQGFIDRYFVNSH